MLNLHERADGAGPVAGVIRGLAGNPYGAKWRTAVVGVLYNVDPTGQETVLCSIASRVPMGRHVRIIEKFNGAPGGTRTPGLLVRSQPLYPAELRARTWLILPRITANIPPACIGHPG